MSYFMSIAHPVSTIKRTTNLLVIYVMITLLMERVSIEMKNDFMVASLFLVLIFSAIFIDEQNEENDYIGYVRAYEDSYYTTTFEKLNLGDIFNFHLVLNDADNHWVTLTVDEYIEGEKQEEVGSLTYGKSVDEIAEGNIGYAILNPHNDNASILLYGTGASFAGSEPLNTREEVEYTSFGGDYAIASENVGLEVGEAKRLAVYRYAGNTWHMYDYQDDDDFQRLLDDSVRTLVFYIQISEDHE